MHLRLARKAGPTFNAGRRRTRRRGGALDCRELHIGCGGGIRTAARIAAHVCAGWRLAGDCEDLLDALGLSPREPRASQGLIVRFYGAPRAGKTLAAYVLAQALSLEVLRIDLAAVSGKYIGEPSKHIDAVFDAAERAGQALLIDEADALFGKRAEVKDAHDRYANLDVAYLLQRIEQLTGS